ISELSHTVINALSFRVEYRRGSGGTAMFQRQVRFQIDLSDVTNTHSPRDYLFAIIFTLHSGNIRRFRRVCEHIQTQMCARKAPSSPRAARKFNADLSESSSCGSDTSERLSPYVNIRNVESDRDDKNKRLINHQDGKGGYCIPNSRQRRRSSSLANNNNFNSSNNNSVANAPAGANGRSEAPPPTRSNSETKPADGAYISVSGSMS
ncbi:serine/threonine-protein kinase BRSK2 isoform X2, partial [Aphis craccivora]